VVEVADIEWTPKAHTVVEAASELFYEHGIHAVGVEAIAERAGVTKKTLYDRFGSKERLVVEYLARRDRQWRELLDRELAGADQTPRGQVAAIFGVTAVWSRERERKGCGMINAHAEISNPAHPAYAVIAGHKRWMLGVFTDLAAAAGVTDPRAIGEQLMLLHEGALVTAGMRAIEDPFATAAAAAAALLDVA
jgi:AcrR family transcriptional regulator